MKRLLAIYIVLILAVAGVAYAGSTLPEDVQEFSNDFGHICYVWPDGSGDCYCPCEGCDESELLTYATPVSPTDTPFTDPTPVPPTPTPIIKMCQYDSSILASDPRCDFCTIFPGGGTWNGIAVDCETVPVEEPSCNRGTGNGPEDCDPGNSGGKPGNAGEENE